MDKQTVKITVDSTYKITGTLYLEPYPEFYHLWISILGSGSERFENSFQLSNNFKEKFFFFNLKNCIRSSNHLTDLPSKGNGHTC